MQTRKLGKTGHNCSILTFGAFALSRCSQKEADEGIAMVLEAGINGVDVSPLYGEAEARLGSWFRRHGKQFFLSCKTAERTRQGAQAGLKRSLDTLGVDYFDLYQFHMVDNQKDLDTLLGPDGALEAVLETKKEGAVKFIGITGHHPPILNRALQQFAFDTVMFPLNRVHAAGFEGWNDWRELLKTAACQEVGVFAIKAVAKRLWVNQEQARYNTWYEPFDTVDEIQKSLWFTLGQSISSAVTPGELQLLPTVIQAARNYQPLSLAEQDRIISEVKQFPPLYAPFMD